VKVLIDTHVLLWWKAGGERMSARARREIARADSVLVSSLTFWEVGTLSARGRVALDRSLHEWIGSLLDEGEIEVVPLSGTAAASAALLDATFPADPADRMIYATAREALVPLVTKDARLREYALAHRDVRVVW
jgi:PIN domain nuclease of toxin-antitoxin system